MDVVPRRQSRRGVGAEEVIKRAKALEQLMVEGQNGRRDRVFHRREVFPQRLLWALDLVEKNVGELYARSPDGWNAKNKKRELASDEARYIFVRERYGTETFNNQKQQQQKKNSPLLQTRVVVLRLHQPCEPWLSSKL